MPPMDAANGGATTDMPPMDPPMDTTTGGATTDFPPPPPAGTDDWTMPEFTCEQFSRDMLFSAADRDGD